MRRLDATDGVGSANPDQREQDEKLMMMRGARPQYGHLAKV